MNFSLRTAVAAAVFSLLSGVVTAGDDDWVSPVYKDFFKYPLPIPPTAVPQTSYTNQTTGVSIDFYEIKIKAFKGQPYPNLGQTDLVGYNGVSPGPTFKVIRGRETVIRFVNEYGRPSAIHLHGSYTRPPFDGWAEDTIAPGEYKDYYFPNTQGSRTMWYHDHAVHITAVNAYYGQAGFYMVYDPAEEARLALPAGKYDVPLMIQAKQYQSNGQLLSPENERESLYGDVIHVNGQPWPYLAVEPRKYRFRLADASISRTFRLSLVESGKTTPIPFQVIASDAGYLSNPVSTSELYISMAERWEIIVDFAAFKGKKILLRNARDVMQDEDYAGTNRVMQFNVGQTVTDPSNNGGPPGSLGGFAMPPPKDGVDKKFKFERTNGEWRINGVAFRDVNSRVLAKPEAGTTEVWELENSSGGWSHPIHIHLVDFTIISRSGGRGRVQPYEAAGLKDVVLLGTNEVVRVRAKYAPWNGGLYMFHCHNLVHEDHDMMAAFNVTKLVDLGYPETTDFRDPMDERWRARPYSGTDLQNVRQQLLPGFSGLDAYYSAKEIEVAMDEYHANGGKPLIKANNDTSRESSTTATPTPTTTKPSATKASSTKPSTTRRASTTTTSNGEVETEKVGRRIRRRIGRVVKAVRGI